MISIKSQNPEQVVPVEEKIYQASQWELVRRRFFQHKLAVISGCLLLLLYLVVMFSGFVSPYDPVDASADRIHVPPQRLHFLDADGC